MLELNQKQKLGLFHVGTFTTSSSLRLASQTCIGSSCGFCQLMGDAVGWAEDELLPWHLPGLGNGAAQHKGGTLPGHLCDPSKPESQAAELGVRRGAEL